MFAIFEEGFQCPHCCTYTILKINKDIKECFQNLWIGRQLTVSKGKSYGA